MKFSYNWLAELTPGLSVNPKELEGLITIKTAESEGVEEYGSALDAVRAARVLSVEPIGGGHNGKAVIDLGPDGKRVVVCGAPNCRAGVITAYVPPGAAIQGRKLAKRVIDGVESEGMLASGIELGINRDHEGILELQGVEPGQRLPGCLPDHIIEIDNKSLTHRPDLWGHFGMAREVSALLDIPLRDPVQMNILPSGEGGTGVEITDFRLCPRYSALVIENVRVEPSPLWLQYRLEAIGLNPINNIVDITNFVMAELSQPMHAFDADKLRGSKIIVRTAKEGERMTALNDESYDLGPSNLVIADSAGAIALAGVIGGADSAISGSTTRIVFESANFNAASVRRTSSKLKLRTDASMRFEKSQDPENTVRGLARALELLRTMCPELRVTGGVADSYRPAPKPKPIELSLDWLERRLGREVEADEVRRILSRLQFGVERPSPGVFSVTVPSWRATKDISIKEDLLEEVGRTLGYASIQPLPPFVPTVPPVINEQRKFEHRLRDMAAAQGFTEVYNYTFISEERARRFGMEPAEHLKVANPISVDQGLLRMSLVPNIWNNIVENSNHSAEFRIFEIGKEIHARGEALPEEIPHLVAAIYSRSNGEAGLMELKRLAECLMESAEAAPVVARPFEHPSRSAEIRWRGRSVGRLFELHPTMVDGRAAMLDIDLAAMRGVEQPAVRYRPIRRFPSSSFDLSVITAERELAGDLQRRLSDLAGGELLEIEFVRQYVGSPLPEGRKSVSFRLTVGAPDRTLLSDEVGVIRARIIDGMRQAGYELRV